MEPGESPGDQVKGDTDQVGARWKSSGTRWHQVEPGGSPAAPDSADGQQMCAGLVESSWGGGVGKMKDFPPFVKPSRQFKF